MNKTIGNVSKIIMNMKPKLAYTEDSYKVVCDCACIKAQSCYTDVTSTLDAILGRLSLPLGGSREE